FRQHVNERQLDAIEEASQLVGFELRFKDFAQAKHHIGLFAGIVARSIDGTFLKWNLGPALPTQVGVRSHCVVKELEAQHVEPVRATTWIENVARKHGVEI